MTSATTRPLLVGILNVTPDSFSDGGRHATFQAAVAGGMAMAEGGADWIDVGGESTRPGAVPVPAEEEIERVVPVIAALAARLAGRVRLSVDTYKAATARAALEAGAAVVNDVSGGLMDPDLLATTAGAGGAVVLGHLRGTPATMTSLASYDDVLEEVARELEGRVAAARSAGCREIWVDPGIGFAKQTSHNLALLAQAEALRARLALPMMVGVSRKRFLGELTGRGVGERDFGTAAAVATLALQGVEALRVHDVTAMGDVLKVVEAIRAAGPRRV